MQQPYLKHLTFAGYCIAAILFIVSPWFFEPHHHNAETVGSMTPIFMATNLLTIIFFYLNGWFLVPRFLLVYKYKTYILTLAGCVLLFVLSTSLFGWFLGIKPPPPPPPNAQNHRHLEHRFRPPVKNNTFLMLLGVWGLSTTLALVNKWRSLEEVETERIANQNAQELSALRAQINPHFLFNTLNNIYSLTQINADAAGDAILQLADFMRYVVQEGDKTAIPLAKEVEYITHYIALQRLRLSEHTQIDFQTSSDLENAQIAPLLFMPFIENAFAYGVSTRLPSHIVVHISVENCTENDKNAKKISLKVENPILKTSRSKSNGVALINTKRRLALLYPNQHTLIISENGAEYKIQLLIQS